MVRAVAAAAVMIVAVQLVPAGEPSHDLGLLADWLTGSFSSASQAAADPEFRDIRLHVARVWPNRSDGIWLYVEQAAAESLDRPYRQRVYHLTQPTDTLFESQVLELPDPERRVGAWRLEQPLADLDPADLGAREGCAILLRRSGNAFAGSTLGRLCESSHRGAAWATSEVILTADRMVSWDRGFDAAGVQVWGAVKGGYVFDRVAEPEPSPAPGAE